MTYQRVPLADFFHEVTSSTKQYLGSVYLNPSADKWAIKEYPGHWFELEKQAQTWLIDRNEPTPRG